MSFTRRQFLLGAAAGLVLPKFYDKVYSYFENHGEPYLQAPKSAQEIMYAVSEWGGYGYQMNLGDIREEPPRMTIREFCDRYGEGDPEQWWRDEWLVDKPDAVVNMDAEMEHWAVMDWWCACDAPHRKARDYLDSIDLGPHLQGGEAVGELRVSTGGPASGLLAYDAVDEVTLSLLQQRLNELNSGIRIVLG